MATRSGAPTQTNAGVSPAAMVGISALSEIAVEILTVFLTMWLKHRNQTGTTGTRVAAFLKALPLTSVKSWLTKENIEALVRDFGAAVDGLAPQGIAAVLRTKGSHVLRVFANEPNPQTVDQQRWEAIVDQAIGDVDTAPIDVTRNPANTVPGRHVLAVQILLNGVWYKKSFPLALDQNGQPLVGNDRKPYSLHLDFPPFVTNRSDTRYILEEQYALEQGFEPCEHTPRHHIQELLALAQHRLRNPPAPPTPTLEPIDDLRARLVNLAVKAVNTMSVDRLKQNMIDYLKEAKNVPDANLRAFEQQWLNRGLTTTEMDQNCLNAFITLIRTTGGGNLELKNSLPTVLGELWEAFTGFLGPKFVWLAVAIVVVAGIVQASAILLWLSSFVIPYGTIVEAKHGVPAVATAWCVWAMSVGPTALIWGVPIWITRFDVTKIIKAVGDAGILGQGDTKKPFWVLFSWIFAISLIPCMCFMLVNQTGIDPNLLGPISISLSVAGLFAYLDYKENFGSNMKALRYVYITVTVFAVLVLLKGLWIAYGEAKWNSFHLFAPADTIGTPPVANNGTGGAVSPQHVGWLPSDWFERVQEAGGAMLCSLMSFAGLIALGAGVIGTTLKKLHAEDAGKVFLKIAGWAGAVLGVSLAVLAVIIVGKSGIEAWKSSDPASIQRTAQPTPPSLTAPSSGGGTNGGAGTTRTGQAPRKPYVPDPNKPGQNAICVKFPDNPGCPK